MGSGGMLKPPAALGDGVGGTWWLALTFHVASGMSGLGRVAWSASYVHGVFRSLVAARTRATSLAVTNPPAFPKPLRMNDATSATHSSRLAPLGGITCG